MSEYAPTGEGWIPVTTSAEMREVYIEQSFRPYVEAMFARDEALQSVHLTVAQFYADEADDAVHLEHHLSTDRDAVFPDCIAGNPYHEPDGSVSTQGSDALGWFNAWETPDRPKLDENTTAITAFASFTKEGCDQEQPLTESASVYAIARRGTGNDAVIEVVGEMLRPEWEDRTDVGFDAEEDDEPLAPQATASDFAPPPPSAAPNVSLSEAMRAQRRRESKGLIGFLRRLFGG